jgi:hypothetical protein
MRNSSSFEFSIDTISRKPSADLGLANAGINSSSNDILFRSGDTPSLADGARNGEA